MGSSTASLVTFVDKDRLNSWHQASTWTIPQHNVIAKIYYHPPLYCVLFFVYIYVCVVMATVLVLAADNIANFFLD